MPKIDLQTLPVRTESSYPAPHDAPIRNLRAGIEVARSGGFSAFGAWHVTLQPGGWSSQRHWHSHEEELVVMISGELILVDDQGETPMRPGDVALFPAGAANGHHLVNRSDTPARFMAVGTDRPDEDICHYPDIGMQWRPGEGYVFPGKGVGG